jgi:pimeloyl-ACP methyl ester carboxylesterase
MSGTEQTVTVDDKTIQLFTGGEGAPLLYLHGAGTYWWMPIHDLLAARHRVYLPVHPGFGASQGYEEIESLLTSWKEAEDGLYAIVGRPETVWQELRAGIKAAGCGILPGIFPVESMPHDLTMKNMELFAREVMPALRAEFP